jgi:hypothetical protein
MAAPIPDFRLKVWFYREPQRSALLIALLALLGWVLVGLVHHRPDPYAYARLVLALGLVVSFLAAAYSPHKWGARRNALVLALALAALAFVLLA